VAAGVYDDKASVADLTKLTDKMSDPTKYPAIEAACPGSRRTGPGALSDLVGKPIRRMMH
jgi:hypothetical protein